jgi:hypothetical protein
MVTEVQDMVGMLDYHLHYAVLAAEDRVRDAMARRRSGQPLRPHRGLRIGRRRSSSRR